jgi:hypothetical protein
MVFKVRGWVINAGDLVGWRGCHFVRRWAISTPSGRGIRIHHFLPNVEEFTPHDHPWWFATFVFRGGYVDVTSESGREVDRDEIRAPAFRFRRGHEHRTITGPNGAWTLVINGAKAREWGFWSAAGQWLPWSRYGALGPRAACDAPDPDEWPTDRREDAALV